MLYNQHVAWRHLFRDHEEVIYSKRTLYLVLSGANGHPHCQLCLASIVVLRRYLTVQQDALRQQLGVITAWGILGLDGATVPVSVLRAGRHASTCTMSVPEMLKS